VNSPTKMKEAITQGIASTIMFASAIVLLPLLFYSILWLLALLTPERINPNLDLYASVWSFAALVAALYNFREARLIIKSFDLSKLLIILLVSGGFIMSCPEWFY
jgi:hypothetical protein